MKHLSSIFALSALAITVASCTQPQQNKSEKIEVEPFSHIVITGDADVTLTQSDGSKIKASEWYGDGLNSVGDTLFVEADEGEFRIPVGELRSITVAGGGDVNVKGSIKVDGSIDIIVKGEGDIEGSFHATDILVSVEDEGDADIKVDCTNLRAMAIGTGDIELRGKCVNYTKRESGFSGIDSRNLSMDKLTIE